MSKKIFNGISTLSVITSTADREDCGNCCIYRVDEAAAKAVAGVCEGCTDYADVRYPEFDDQSGAFIGSRISAAGVLSWFTAERCLFNDSDAERLHSSIDVFMRKAKRRLDYEGKPIFKKKARTFASSAAVIAVDYASDSKVECEFLWAGNNRGYVLDTYGLCQITDDDVSAPKNALRTRVRGERLANAINADTDYNINFRRINVNEPMMLISSTVAGFDDFSSPMEFEYAILYALIKASNIADWETRLKSIIREYTENDFSMTVMSVGFTDFNQMKAYYEPRVRQLIEQYIRPLNAARSGESSISPEELWREYKNGYYR
jgi:hypothetical protein